MRNERDAKRIRKVQRYAADPAFAAHAAMLDIADELEALREQSRGDSAASAKAIEALAAALSRPLVSIEISGDVTVSDDGGQG